MNVSRHLFTMDQAELAELYRHWTGGIAAPDADEAVLKSELLRLMTDRDAVSQRFRDLPPKCREFLAWMLSQEDYALSPARIDDESGELPVKSFEVEAIAKTLGKRGFLTEIRDRSWMHYQETVYRIPTELGDVLSSLVKGDRRSLESQLLLRAYLRTVGHDDVRRRLQRLGLSPDLAADRQGMIARLSTRESVERAIATLPDPAMREVVQRVVDDHGGIGEVRHLARLGLEVPDPDRWRLALEDALLGTVLDGDLTDVGIQLGAGSIIVFLDVVRGLLLSQVETEVEDEPEPPADLAADLAAVRTFLDHHSVRVTRDGTLYRATVRKMETELLSPGWRPVDREAALAFILRFLSDADLVRPDVEGRMRTTKKWKDLEGRSAVEQAELVLGYVQNDLRDAQGAFHLPRLRRIFLSVLREAGPSRWVALRPLAILSRNRYFATLDRPMTADRFQKRYKYAPIPPMASPGALVRELVRFGAEALALAGVVTNAMVDEQPVAVRLTRLGAALLGLPTDAAAGGDDGALIVTADFEIVLFPEAGGIELVREVGRFAKREKADYSLHYRITERTIQEAVAQGLSADDICGILRRHGRHELPQNVEQSLRAWAAAVHVLEARRTLVIRAPSAEALEAALRVREFRAIAGERLNPTMVELGEDPSSPRVAEALRAQGFFLR